MNVFTSPEAWLGLLTLTVLEIVLGIDNIIFISILAGKLPQWQQGRARRVGLAGAMFTRIALLAALAWIIRLTAPLFHLLGHAFAGRDLILVAGGLFLIAKSTREIHEGLEGETDDAGTRVRASFAGVVGQIVLLDIVFSLDSVIRRRDGAPSSGDDRGGGARGGRDDVRGSADQRLRPSPSDGEDARAELSLDDRCVAHRRRTGSAHRQGLHLFRDGLLGVRRDVEAAYARAHPAGAVARGV